MENQELQNSSVQTTEGQTVVSYIDGYCERQNKPDVMAEPLNLITNLAFIIGAIMAFRMLRLYKQIIAKNFDLIILNITLFAIGLGSAAYHSYPNGTTVLMDVIPITIFIHLYIVSFFRRVIGLNIVSSLIALAAFIGVGVLFQLNISPDTLNGTIMYVPTYLMLIVMILLMGFVKQNPLYLHLINTAVIWTFSLAFRTMDTQICPHTQHIGTHFLWHLLNGIVLYRMLVLVVIHKVSQQNSKTQPS
jgi:hypothetical protein